MLSETNVFMLVQTKDDKGVKGATDEQCKMVVHIKDNISIITKDNLYYQG